MTMLIRIAVIVLTFCSLCGAIVFPKSFGFAVSRNNRRQRNKNAIPTWNFHADYDSDESISNTYTAISSSKQILALRLSGRTVVAYAQSIQPNGTLLQQSLGCKPLHTLLPSDARDSSQVYLLLTGVSGDCRSAVRHLKQVAVNHTFDFAIPPSGEYLANRLGAYLLEQRSSRPLAVHAFVISPGNSQAQSVARGAEAANIFEVGVTGSVNSVRGGTIGGAHMQKARQHLESNYKEHMTVDEVKNMLATLFDSQLSTTEDSSGVVLNEPKALYQYLEIPDN